MLPVWVKNNDGDDGNGNRRKLDKRTGDDSVAGAEEGDDGACVHADV